MEKDFDLRHESLEEPFDSMNSWHWHGAGKKVEAAERDYIREKDLRKIHRAACRGNVPEVQRLLLLRPGRLNARDRRDRTALHLACACGHLGVVTLLTDRKCELNLRDNENRTALMKAIEAQEEECVSLLLEHGADPNIKEESGYTALHYAVMVGNIAIATKLLQHRADIEATDKHGFTPFISAAYKNNEEMVEFLIKKDANINATDEIKRTALMFAARNNFPNMVTRLLQQGADVFATDYFGRTAAEFARSKNLKIIHQQITDYEKAVRSEVFSENSQLVGTCSKKDPASSVPCKPGIDGSRSTSQDKDFIVDPKDKQTKPAIRKRGNGMAIMERAPQEHTSNENWTHVDGVHQNNRSVPMSALGSGEEKDVESPEDSESVPERRPQKSVDPFLFAANQRRKYILPTQVQEIHLSTESEKEQVRLDGSENNHVAWEQNDTQRRRSREQNDGMLQDAMLTIDFCKQKEKEIDVKKKNSEVSESHEKQRDLTCEIAVLTLELDATKNKHLEMEKKYFEDIAVVKGKTEDLQTTIELNEETLMNTISQYHQQLKVLTAENKRLTSELGSEKQKRERLETEVESYRSELATAMQAFEQSQESERRIRLTCQREREELFALRDKPNFDMSNLKHNNEILSQQLSDAESKFSRLETEFRHTRDFLTEANLVLEHVHRDLSQIQCQKKEIEDMYQSEREKVNTYIAKLKCLEEKCSHLQSENMWLRQQLDDACNKSHNEKRIINIQDLMQDIIKLFQAQTEKLVLMVEESNKELINECTHLNERLHQLEKIEAEREVVGRQLQQGLPDHLKELALSEASLEVLSHDRMNLESERQGLTKTSEQMRRKLEEARDRHAEDARRAEKKQDHVQKLENENVDFKASTAEEAVIFEQLQRFLLCISSMEQELQEKITQEQREDGAVKVDSEFE